MRVFVSAAAAIVFAWGAHASTVTTLGFTAGSNSVISWTGFSFTGTWQEQGYRIDWEYVPPDFSLPNPGSFNGFKRLSTAPGGPEPNGRMMTISRADGKAFSLKSIHSLLSSDASADVNGNQIIGQNSLQLNGTTSTGGAYSQLVSTTLNPTGGGSFGPASVSTGTPALSSLTLTAYDMLGPTADTAFFFGGNDLFVVDIGSLDVTMVPLPAAASLLLAGLGALVVVRRRSVA